jgi:hypothetical protein
MPNVGGGNKNPNAGGETTKSTRSMKDGYESKSNYNPKSDPCATGGNSWY